MSQPGDAAPCQSGSAIVAAAVLAAYHAKLVPPFCVSAIKSFFDAH